MAKGMRSKCKRANRSLLRKNLTLPIIAKRVEKVSNLIANDLMGKESKSSMLALKKAFQTDKNVNTTNDEGEEEDEVDITGDYEHEANNIVDQSESKAAKRIKSLCVKRTGSKPRNNPGKQLVWF